MRIQLRNILAVTLITLVTACGGGGGGDGGAPVASTETFQLRAAYINRFTQPISTTGHYSGTLNGVQITGSATAVSGAPTSTTFEGVAALQKVGTVTGSISGNGVNVPVSATATTYTDLTYYPLGSYGNGEYTVVTGAVNIPVTAKVYDTGIAYIENRYTSSSKVSFLGTTETTFALFADTSSTVLLKLTETKKNSGGAVIDQSIGTFRMTPTGGLTYLNESYINASTNTSALVTY